MRTSRSILAVGLVFALTACGGGGGGGSGGYTEEVIEDAVIENGTYTPRGPLAKYVGRYSFCSDHTEYQIEFSPTGDDDLSADVREITYQGEDCTGATLATFFWSAPASVSYSATGIATVRGAGLPTSLSLDKVKVSVQEVRGQLSGMSVSGNCVTYPKGSFCYDLTTTQTNESQGGLYLVGGKLYELQLDNGVYSVTNTYTKR